MVDDYYWNCRNLHRGIYLVVVRKINMSVTGERAKRRKLALLQEYDFTCVYCPTKLTLQTVTFDHLIPKSKGGKKGRRNLVPACHDCNNARRNFLNLEELEKYVIKVRGILMIVARLIRKFEITSEKMI